MCVGLYLYLLLQITTFVVLLIAAINIFVKFLKQFRNYCEIIPKCYKYIYIGWLLRVLEFTSVIAVKSAVKINTRV